MAKITIHKDGSFEAVANRRTYATEIRGFKDQIAAFKRFITDANKHVKALHRIDELKKELKHAQPKRAEKIKDMIDTVRFKYGLKPNATVSGAETRVRKAEAKIASLEKRIERLAKLEAEQKEKAKSAPVKKSARLTGPMLDGPKPQPKVKIVNSTRTDKKAGDTLTKMQASYAEITEQLKRDMPPSKKSRLRSERARLRVMIAELKRGQKAANKKATENKAKPSGNMGSSKSKVVPKSGMGSAKKIK